MFLLMIVLNSDLSFSQMIHEQGASTQSPPREHPFVASSSPNVSTWKQLKSIYFYSTQFIRKSIHYLLENMNELTLQYRRKQHHDDDSSEIAHLNIDSMNVIQQQGDTTSTTVTSSSDYNFGGDYGLTIKKGLYACARCYYSNFSTEEYTFPPKITPKNQYFNNTEEQDAVTIVFAMHHAEQLYAPRETLYEITIEVRAPAYGTVDLVLSNNLEPFTNDYGSEVSQNFVVKIYNHVYVRRIISHGLSTKHRVSVDYKFNHDNMEAPKIMYMCNNTETCEYPTITEKAFDFQTGGLALITYLRSKQLITDYSTYISCTTAKSLQIRSEGACYVELKQVAVLFISLTYAFVGSCLLFGIYCVCMFLIAALCLCKKEFKTPEFA